MSGGSPVAGRWDLLVAVMGTPYASDATTTMLRWVDAAAAGGARVQVWTCGYATMLTQRALGAEKPRNAMAWNEDYPTSATVVQEMLARHEGHLRWLSCRFCSDERGALDHVEPVRLRPAFSFGNHVRESGKTVFVGVI
jgi:hypothetical protein